MSRVLSPELVPVKQAVRGAVSALGGIDGVVPIVDRQRSTVGRWVNINDADLPTLDAAIAIDQALIIIGRKPMVASAMTRILGATLLAGVTDGVAALSLLSAHTAIVREGGDLQVALAEALADGNVDDAERQRLRNEIADNVDALHALDLLLQRGGPK
jgi:hypothetical protein